jgi:hypothetical protein
MAKPRIFVSSTYIDLKHARRHIEAFIKQIGYETVLFESGDITFHHDIVLDESCYAEIETCHMLILIIGGKYGSAASEHEEDAQKIKDKEILFYNSITRNEYLKAREKNIPIFIFVDKGVYSEYQTFKKNRDNSSTQYAHVDSVNIFKLLDDILAQRTNNFIKAFENFEDITSWLKDQWAGMFADFLGKKTTDINIKTLQQQISELNEVSQSLKTYNEILLKSISNINSEEIIKKEDDKLRHRKALRFTRNPMIRYLIRKLNDEILPNEIYEAFIITSNLKAFLKQIKFSAPEVSRFSIMKAAQQDYLKLRNEFLGEENIVEDEE